MKAYLVTITFDVMEGVTDIVGVFSSLARAEAAVTADLPTRAGRYFFEVSRDDYSITEYEVDVAATGDEDDVGPGPDPVHDLGAFRGGTRIDCNAQHFAVVPLDRDDE